MQLSKKTLKNIAIASGAFASYKLSVIINAVISLISIFHNPASIGIIGAADGPTAILVSRIFTFPFMLVLLELIFNIFIFTFAVKSIRNMNRTEIPT